MLKRELTIVDNDSHRSAVAGSDHDFTWSTIGAKGVDRHPARDHVGGNTWVIPDLVDHCQELVEARAVRRRVLPEHRIRTVSKIPWLKTKLCTLLRVDPIFPEVWPGLLVAVQSKLVEGACAIHERPHLVDELRPEPNPPLCDKRKTVFEEEVEWRHGEIAEPTALLELVLDVLTATIRPHFGRERATQSFS